MEARVHLFCAGCCLQYRHKADCQKCWWWWWRCYGWLPLKLRNFLADVIQLLDASELPWTHGAGAVLQSTDGVRSLGTCCEKPSVGHFLLWTLLQNTCLFGFKGFSFCHSFWYTSCGTRKQMSGSKCRHLLCWMSVSWIMLLSCIVRVKISQRSGRIQDGRVSKPLF